MDSKTICMRFVGYYLAIWICVLVVLLFWFWPKLPTVPRRIIDPNTPSAQIPEPNGINNEGETSAKTGQPGPESQASDSEALLILKRCPVSGLRFVGLVLIMGALGACLHGISSLAYHRGLCDFSEKWTLWYLYRPGVGGVLALIFYLIINGGLVPQANGSDKKFFWILGLSGLIGLFSKQALNKLSLIFDAVFASDKEKNEKSPKTPQNPVIPPPSNVQDDTNTTETPTTQAPPEGTPS
jgi:hypothetical protein